MLSHCEVHFSLLVPLLLLLLLLLLLQLIRSCRTPEEQSLAYITLSNRMLSQCEVQVLRIGSFAFPLAYVCVAVGAAHPHFMELLLAKLQQVRC
jgi:hypothetical protein